MRSVWPMYRERIGTGQTRNTIEFQNENVISTEQWTGDSLYSTPMAKLDLVHDSMRNISMFSRSNDPSELIRYDPSFGLHAARKYIFEI